MIGQAGYLRTTVDLPKWVDGRQQGTYTEERVEACLVIAELADGKVRAVVWNSAGGSDVREVAGADVHGA